MATLNAGTVVEKLTALGHDHNPDKIRYKTAELAGNTVVLYDRGGAPRELQAQYAQEYVAKGFTISPPEVIADIAEELAPPDADEATEAEAPTPTKASTRKPPTKASTRKPPAKKPIAEPPAGETNPAPEDNSNA